MFKSLLIWYKDKARDLPWRTTNDPYKIWLSEIILQQTRVDQGLSYYKKFVARFPKVEDLAAADLDEVLLMWQGLGYYSRARNLHQASQTIVKEYNGRFPVSLGEIKKLKGIGDYTAAAIASFAYNFPAAVVDGNVFRLLSRYFEVSTPIDTSAGKKEFDNLASKILNLDYPGLHNQAMMELGATICTPKAPKCNSCPLESGCGAYATGNIFDYPVKKGKINQRVRHFYYLILLNTGNVIIQKRVGKDIWEGLFQFPLIETDKKLNDHDLLIAVNDHVLLENSEYVIESISRETKHILSHQVIHAKYITIRLGDQMPEITNSYQVVKFTSLNEYAFPRLITRYLEQINKKE